MKIVGSTQQELKPYINPKLQTETPSLVTGTIAGLSHNTDTVEISPSARQLAASDIVNHSAVYFGTAQINDSLTRLLKDQPAEVKKAVYGIIQSNLITNVTGEEDRAALLELGLTQARFIADNYMNNNEAAELMKTFRQIGAISKTRTIDPDTKQIQYDTPAQRPVGAPEDYIDLTAMMRTFEPQTLNKLQDAIINGKDWGSVLVDFAKKVASHSDWVKQYREETAHQVWDITGENRFEKASTASRAAFAKDITGIIDTTEFQNAGLLKENMEAFLRTLGGSRSN